MSMTTTMAMTVVSNVRAVDQHSEDRNCPRDRSPCQTAQFHWSVISMRTTHTDRCFAAHRRPILILMPTSSPDTDPTRGPHTRCNDIVQQSLLLSLHHPTKPPYEWPENTQRSRRPRIAPEPLHNAQWPTTLITYRTEFIGPNPKIVHGFRAILTYRPLPLHGVSPTPPAATMPR